MESRIEKRDMVIQTWQGDVTVDELASYFDLTEDKYDEVSEILEEMVKEIDSDEDFEEELFDRYVTRINQVANAPQEAYDELVNDTICELIMCDEPYEKAMGIMDQRGFTLDEEFKGVTEDEYYSRLAIVKPRQKWAGLSEIIDGDPAKFSKWLNPDDFPITKYHEV